MIGRIDGHLVDRHDGDRLGDVESLEGDGEGAVLNPCLGQGILSSSVLPGLITKMWPHPGAAPQLRAACRRTRVPASRSAQRLGLPCSEDHREAVNKMACIGASMGPAP